MLDLVVIAVAAGIVLVVIAAAAFLVNKPKALNQSYFNERWTTLQKLCSDKTTWPLAIIDADKLLDEALRRRKYKGKTMGERLVKAQRDLSNNDSVWFGHKLRNKLVHEHDVKLKESDVKQALLGIRQALKDLGAIQ